MAFTFNSEDDSEEKKTNIFAPQEAGGGDPSQPAGGAVTKATVSGGSGGEASAPSSSAPGASSGPVTPGAKANAYRSLQATFPTAGVERTKGQIAGANNKLQEESNSYVQNSNEAAKGYQLSDADLEGAASGSKDPMEKVTKQLSQGSAPVYKSFEGLADKDMPDVSAYAGADTFTDLIRETAGPQYSTGAARLDANLLKRDPRFRSAQAEIQSGSKNLQAASDKAQETLTTQARAAQDAGLKSGNESAKTRLKGMGEGIITAAQKAEVDEEAKRAGIDPASISAEQFKTIADIIRQDWSANTPRAADARALDYLNDYDTGSLKDFVTIDKDVDWKELVSEGDVRKYNNITSLLGEGDSLAYVAGGAGDPYSFDQEGALNRVGGELRGKRLEADKASQAEIDRIIAENEAEAAASTQSRDSRYGWDDFKNYVGPDVDQAAIDELAYRTEHGDQDLARILTSPKNTEALTWEDMLSADEASQLGGLYEDSGQLGEFQAGAGQGSRYDVEALKKYYDDVIAKRQKPAAPAPASPGSGGIRKPNNKVR